MVEVEEWAEIRRMHFVLGVSIKEIARRTGPSQVAFCGVAQIVGETVVLRRR